MNLAVAIDSGIRVTERAKDNVNVKARSLETDLAVYSSPCLPAHSSLLHDQCHVRRKH